MTATPATSAYSIVLAVHVMAVVVAFGWTFTLPIVYAVASQRDPRSLPVLHRIEYTVSRLILNPALVVILGAGIYMASDGHHWNEFFVQWGIGAVIVIGALVGSVLIPAAKRAEEAARADMQAFTGGEFQPGEEYRALTRRLSLWGSAASLLVLLTILFMVIEP